MENLLEALAGGGNKNSGQPLKDAFSRAGESLLVVVHFNILRVRILPSKTFAFLSSSTAPGGQTGAGC